MTSSSSACCKISRAPSRPTVSIGSSSPATPASTSSSSERNLSLGATFSMRAYLHRFDLSGQSGGYARLFNSPGGWDATRLQVAGANEPGVPPGRKKAVMGAVWRRVANGKRGVRPMNRTLGGSSERLAKLTHGYSPQPSYGLVYPSVSNQYSRKCVQRASVGSS